MKKAVTRRAQSINARIDVTVYRTALQLTVDGEGHSVDNGRVRPNQQPANP
jgi:hypothetical protein